MLWLKIALFCVVVLEVKTEKVKITKDLIKVFLGEHNAARKKDGVPALTWNDDLSKKAEDWASKCQWKHSKNGNGENLYSSGPKSTDYAKVAKKSVTKWVDEKKYVKPDWTCSGKCGHYTQVVWKTTKSVGCAIVHCDNDDLDNFVVCQYSPPGNYKGQKPF